MKKSLNIIKNILLTFILISIGFALGKNYSSLSNGNGKKIEQNANTENSNFVKVYYFHSTFRCSTCNKIEKLTKELLQEKFSRYIDAKKIIFKEIDFQANEKLAEKYAIVASSVVVVLKKDNKTVQYKRLDKVWTLIDKPNKFNTYISDTVDAYLEKLKE
ncbi:MAG: nitrophenyl compound nitroreductase subunit ArsF family protein [Victivallales bacterium]|nr:nitrophenyl compound nitroreductase subunit ArsF family protein [Victivallales bacterium]